MTIQVLQHTGGRRFGPTAWALRARHGTTAAGETLPVGRVPYRAPSGDRRSVPTRGAAIGRSSAPEAVGPTWVGDRRARQVTTGPSRGSAGAPTARRIAAVDCPRGSSAGPYRVGRWTRLAMTLAVTAALIVGSVTMATRSNAAPTRFVTVQPGDTLLAIVARDVPGMNPADAVDLVQSLNGLTGSDVRAGEVLRIPAR